MKERRLGTDPKTKQEIIVRTGRFGPYVQVGEATDENPKPHRASLNKNQLMDTLTLDDALKLLVLPRTLGKLDDGEDLIVNKGPFGPYLKSGKTNVSLPPEEDPTTISFETAKTLFVTGAEQKRKLLEPIAELGKDPDSKGTIVVKNGRYGAYVTDGKTNVTVPKDQDPKTVTLKQAIEMLEKKRKSPRRAWRGKKATTTETEA